MVSFHPVIYDLSLNMYEDMKKNKYLEQVAEIVSASVECT